MMDLKQIEICKEVLKSFIFKIRTSDACRLVFHYYSDSIYVDNEDKMYPVGSPEYIASFNFDKIKKKISKRILSNRNNEYWNLEESKIKILENICINNPDEFDNLFKDYINFLWKCSLKEQQEEFERLKKEEIEKEESVLKVILKEKYNTYAEVVSLLLKDTIEYPYKSDKIKALLELKLDIDTIFLILQTREKWIAPKGYIEKYYKERLELLKQNKITIYELDFVIKRITNQLKSNNS